MARRIGPPPELALYRATKAEIQAMGPDERAALTCQECGAVYRFRDFVPECAAHHRRPTPPSVAPQCHGTSETSTEQ